MNTVLALIYSNSYLILLIAAFLNSTTIAILGGVAAHAEHLSLSLGILVLFVSTALFNQIFFFIGLKTSDALHLNIERLGEKHRVIRYINTHPRRFVLIYRFFPGIRFISPFFLGASTPISIWKFLVYDMIASLIWSVLFAMLGFLCGAVAKRLFSSVSHYENVAFVIIIAIALLWIAFRYIRKYFHKRTLKQQHATASSPVQS